MAARFLTHFLIFIYFFFPFCDGWVCHDQELLNLFIPTVYTEVFLTNGINCIVKKSLLQLEGEAGEIFLAQGSPSPVNVTET